MSFIRWKVGGWWSDDFSQSLNHSTLTRNVKARNISWPNSSRQINLTILNSFFHITHFSIFSIDLNQVAKVKLWSVENTNKEKGAPVKLANLGQTALPSLFQEIWMAIMRNTTDQQREFQPALPIWTRLFSLSLAINGQPGPDQQHLSLPRHMKIHLAIWTNALCNLDKYILQFR